MIDLLKRHANVLMWVLTIATFIYVIETQQAEQELRRNENCLLFEHQHLDEVNELKNTYKFLDDPPAKLRDFVPTVVQGLPALEKKAREDRAPDYCDEPGAAAEKKGAKPIGLPEPDPVLPPRRDFSYLLR